MMRRAGSVTLIHLAVNAILLWLGYYWLGMGETKASTLIWSGLTAVTLALLICWTYGASFLVFQGHSVRTAWGCAVRNSFWLFVAAAAIAIIYYTLAAWQNYSAKPALTIASFLTLTIRKPVTPAGVAKILDGILFFIRWVVVPVLVLPMLAAIVSQGRSGFAAFGSFSRWWLYWIAAPVLLLSAFALPLKLLAWIPEQRSFQMEVISFAFRGVVAYLLFCAAWLVLAFVTARGTPVLTQSKTVDSL